MGADMTAIVLARTTPIEYTYRDAATTSLLATVAAADAWLPAALTATTQPALAHLHTALDQLLWDTHGEIDAPEDIHDRDFLTSLLPAVTDIITDALRYDPVHASRHWHHEYLSEDAHLYIAGGLSWGDSPTEAHQYWLNLLTIDIDNEILRSLGYIPTLELVSTAQRVNIPTAPA